MLQMEQIGIQSGFISSHQLGMVLYWKEISSVEFADNNLTGEIPSEIVNLTDLRELNLHKKRDIWYNTISFRKFKNN
jgi:hypothetical protein